MEAHAKSLEFVCNESRIIIPYFQRGYVWDEQNWEDLLSDLLNFSTNHFLGSLILKQVKVATGEPKQVLVIDGQQRLTTLSILVRALYDLFTDDLKDNAEDALRAFLFYKRNRTDKKYHIKIQHSRIDAVAFRSVIENEERPDLNAITAGSSKILRCYKYFRTELARVSAETTETLFNKLLDKENKILVVIDLLESDNEQSIFDTINSAGVRLSAADIIKNNLFQKAIEIKEEDDDALGLYEQTWNATFLSDEETINFWDAERATGRAMRDNIEILLHSISVIESIYDPDKHTLANLGDIYKEKIAGFRSFGQVKAFAEKICEYAKLYREKIATFNPSSVLSYRDNLGRLLHVLDVLQLTTFHPYVLHVLRSTPREDEQNKLFHLLERYVVRRMIVNETTKSYNKICREFIAEPNSLHSKVDEVSDERISTALRSINNKPAALLLFWIELYRRFKESNKFDEDSLKFDYSLEHVMPQKWESHWPLPGKVDEKIETNYRVKAIYSIGNMTLLTTGLNSSLKNFELSRKMNGEGRKKGIKSYASLSITRDDLVTPYEKGNFDWNEDTIEARSVALQQTILEIW